jgi:hypothetical protein
MLVVPEPILTTTIFPLPKVCASELIAQKKRREHRIVLIWQVFGLRKSLLMQSLIYQSLAKGKQEEYLRGNIPVRREPSHRFDGKNWINVLLPVNTLYCVYRS